MNLRIVTIVLGCLALTLIAGVITYSHEEPQVFHGGPLTVETQEVVTWIDADGNVINQHDGARIVYHVAADGSLATEEFIPDRDGRVRRGRRIRFANGYELFLDDRTGSRVSTMKSGAARQRELKARGVAAKCVQSALKQTTRTEHGLEITRTPKPGGDGYVDRAPALGCEVVGHESTFEGNAGAKQIVTRRIVRVTPMVLESVFLEDERGYVERSPEEHWKIELLEQGHPEQAVEKMLTRKGIQTTQEQYTARRATGDQRPDWAKARCCGQ